jgi:hypothetical protein
MMNPLPENVTTVVITPYLQLRLLPKGAPDWDLSTNNNWIKVENAVLGLEEEIQVILGLVDVVLDTQITEIRSEVQNEAIARSVAIAALHARFTNVPMTVGSAVPFVHDLGAFPQVSVIRQIGVNQGADVTNAFDTLITHDGVNKVFITVGISGTYTIICGI